jgi:hypothetical protein
MTSNVARPPKGGLRRQVGHSGRETENRRAWRNSFLDEDAASALLVSFTCIWSWDKDPQVDGGGLEGARNGEETKEERQTS